MKLSLILALTSVSAINRRHHKWVPGVTFIQDSPISEAKDDRYFEESFQRDQANGKEAQEIKEVKLTKEQASHIAIDGLIHKNGKIFDPIDMHEVSREISDVTDVQTQDHPISDARDDMQFEQSVLRDQAAEDFRESRAQAQKKVAASKKKAPINKFDGLIHSQGKTYDPNTGEEVSMAEANDDS